MPHTEHFLQFLTRRVSLRFVCVRSRLKLLAALLQFWLGVIASDSPIQAQLHVGCIQSRMSRLVMLQKYMSYRMTPHHLLCAWHTMRYMSRHVRGCAVLPGVDIGCHARSYPDRVKLLSPHIKQDSSVPAARTFLELLEAASGIKLSSGVSRHGIRWWHEDQGAAPEVHGQLTSWSQGQLAPT